MLKVLHGTIDSYKESYFYACSHSVAKNELRFCADVFLRFEVESVENGGSVSDNRRLSERSVEDLAKNVNHSSTHGMTRAARALTVR